MVVVKPVTEETSRAAKFSIDPERVAYLEAEGWRAYYDHNWPRMLTLMRKLNAEQFHMPALASLLAAYYTVQAGRHWAPPRADRNKTQYYLTHFYRHARAHSGLVFDPAYIGELEMAYWEVHRRRRAGGPHEEYVAALTALHSALFNLTPEAAAPSAEYRVRANELVIEITKGRVDDVEKAWTELEDLLRGCWRSVVREMDRASGVA